MDASDLAREYDARTKFLRNLELYRRQIDPDAFRATYVSSLGFTAVYEALEKAISPTHQVLRSWRIW